MSDDLVKQSIAELQDIVHCDCGSAYLERGRHSHACLHYMADALKIVTDRIEELETKLAKVKASYRRNMMQAYPAYTSEQFDKDYKEMMGETT